MIIGLQGLLWLLGLALLFAAASALAFRSWRRHAKQARGKPGYALLRSGPETSLDNLLEGLEASHPGKNGLAGLFENADAFAARTLSAQSAGRSLDLMYYIWHTDLTGWLLLRDIQAAADRGVRVRLLLDDANVQGYDLVFLQLAQHPNVEVRLFNPIRNRGHAARRWLEIGLGLSRFNRRLHCKAWIADGRAAIIGGRNIGDTYFGASRYGKAGANERNSRDADLLVAGPLVAEIETVFDSYWNMGLVLPILALWPNFKISQRHFRKQLAQRASTVTARAFHKGALAGRDAKAILADSLRWTGSARLLADPPDKAYGRRKTPWMAEQVQAVLNEARSAVHLITPYFVPGTAGLAALQGLLRRGVAVSLLTNALSASDNVFVHGAYRRYRGPLLKAGARIFEFAPLAGRRRQRDVLHSKVFLIDGQRAIVGSLNFDMRSAHTNTEMGILFEQADVVAELSSIFARYTGPDQAYALSTDRGSPRWAVSRAGLPKVMRVEPEASTFWRGVSWIVGQLPIHGWL
jgi:putative cardiolipin synthase